MVAYKKTYLDKVGDLLIKIKVGQYAELAKLVKPENKDIFVEAVKFYIDARMGHLEGWQIEFSNDYSRIKKINR